MKTTRMTSKQLVELRRSCGLNQSQFWGRVGVTQSGGSRYESGRFMPKPVETLVRIAYTDEFKSIVNKLRDRAVDQ